MGDGIIAAVNARTFLEGLATFPWLSTAQTLRERFREDRLGLTASSLTFTTTIALVPFFTVALALFTAFPIIAKLQASLQQWLVQSLVPDAIARQVIGYLTQFAGKASRLGFVGRSMGGGITYNAIVADPDLVDAAVVFAPVSSDFVDNLRQFTEPNRPDGASGLYARHGTPEESPGFYRGLSSRTYFDRIEVPVLIHHGTLDDTCPPAWSRETHRLMQRAGVDSTLVEWPGEGHAFGPRFADSMRRTVAFLRAELGL